MPIRPRRRPFNQTVTVRLDDDLMDKIDELAMTLNRSRTDMVRHVLQHAQLSGMPDVLSEIPSVRQPRESVSGIIRERLEREAIRDLQPNGACDDD
jgi:hypothetical protein